MKLARTMLLFPCIVIPFTFQYDWHPTMTFPFSVSANPVRLEYATHPTNTLPSPLMIVD